MSANTAIEWTDATWNPVRGCSRVSEGCRHCYAERVAARFSDEGKPFHGFAKRAAAGPRWTGKVAVVESHLRDPLSWRKPRRVFVNSMSDLFHEGLTTLDIDRVFAVMAVASRHTFQILTKRPARMLEYVRGLGQSYDRLEAAARAVGYSIRFEGIPLVPWPLPNVWLGVSVEDQDAAGYRIPLLAKTPAAVRFLSCEPLLAPLDLTDALDRMEFTHDDGHASLYRPAIGWVIAGAESGPGARPMDEAWVRTIRNQCAEAGVSFFYKQRVENGRKVSLPVLDGVSHSEFPAHV